MATDPSPPDADPWAFLQSLTTARIGLPRSGASLATRPLLEFRLAHAQARDAVHDGLDVEGLAAVIRPLSETVVVDSAASDRRTYLMRPDLGRRLGDAACPALGRHAGDYDLAIVLADGLSARAVAAHAQPVLAALLPRLAGWRLAPVTIVRQGRVAAGDAVALALGARAVVVLIGERPGLSAPDSLGAYLTWGPQPGTTDAERNCLSNIRAGGLDHEVAAAAIARLLAAMRQLGRSGVTLKDDSANIEALP